MARPARAPEAWTKAPAACPVATRAEPTIVAAGSMSVMISREACSPVLCASARLDRARTMRLTMAAARTASAVVVQAGGVAVRVGHRHTSAYAMGWASSKSPVPARPSQTSSLMIWSKLKDRATKIRPVSAPAAPAWATK